MPPPIPVELVPHSPQWAYDAQVETLRLLRAFQPNMVVVHHVGSTAIPGICAKPILDLMPVVGDLSLLDDSSHLFRQLGYEYWGEYGIPGRRYCTLNDPITGKRKIQLHSFDMGSSEIERHLAFRDYLRENRPKAQDYAQLKERCQRLHPKDSHAYSDAKAEWIAVKLEEAIAWYRRNHSELSKQQP